MKFLKYLLCFVLPILVSSQLFSQTKEWIVYTSSDSTLFTNQVIAVAIDSNSNKWIGTYLGGGINEISYDWQKQTGHAYGPIYSLAVDTNNIVWAGSGGLGLGECYNGSWGWLTPSNSQLPSLYVISIAVDQKNNKWIGTNEGLAKFDGRSWTKWTTADGLPSNTVYAIVIDSVGHVWAGTDKGLAKFNGQTWTAYNTQNSGLVDNFVWSLAKDKKGNIWIGTFGGGLSKFDGTSWSAYFSGVFVRAVAVDDSGYVWAGIYGGGVQEFDDHNWISYTTSNSGLPSDKIDGITVDPHNNKWISTDGGGLAVYKAGGVDQSFTIPPSPPPIVLDKQKIIDFESSYIDSCVVPSGGIIMARWWINTFQGTPHYKISPYASNFAAVGLLDDPTLSNLVIVKNWMTWVFNHLNADGTIYDYYVSGLQGGTELPAIDSYPGDNISDPDYNAKDSYAATFFTLAKRYIEVVPTDISWLKGYTSQLRSIGSALYSVIDDSTHMFGPDKADGLAIGKSDFKVKFTMDNSEVNEGLRSMVWLEQHVLGGDSSSFYEKLLNNQYYGFENLWNPNASSYYMYEGGPTSNWDTLWADGLAQLWPIMCGVVSPTSSRAVSLYNTFNIHYPTWQTGTTYSAYPWSAVFSLVASKMNDTTRANSYLGFIQNLINVNLCPSEWYVMEAGFALRAAKEVGQITSVIEVSKAIPQSLALAQNYPNPFNPATVIKASLNHDGMISLKIYNLLGQLVMTVDQGYKAAGEYSYNVNMSNFASGVYLYTLRQNDNFVTRKMILIK